ncbi:hypothetical protein [Lentibacillus juripiscarius]|uniref:Sporulation histidine kinase inhibitor Sda n=1 Tax=Lentibacillus juripiscarius TaxID=257446 RepID=A0ABW5V8P3_9BACI
MAEQERYKRLLEKLIRETENATIQSADEMVQKLVRELADRNTSAADHFR